MNEVISTNTTTTNNKTKQKTILAVWNAGGKGKTESLREFALNLLDTHSKLVTFNPIVPNPSTVPKKGDFRLVVEISGIIIGVESQGDPGTNLENRLIDLAKNFNCDIIICTCRTRGETVAAIQNIKNTFGFQTIWTSTYQIEDESQHATANDLKGKHILELLQKLGLI